MTGTLPIDGVLTRITSDRTPTEERLQWTLMALPPFSPLSLRLPAPRLANPSLQDLYVIAPRLPTRWEARTTLNGLAERVCQVSDAAPTMRHLRATKP